MRYFLRGRIPDAQRVLLVESGSRWVLEKAYARMRSIFPGARFDLCTCFSGEPAPGGFENVYRVTDAPGTVAKVKMLLAMRRSRAPIAALVFSREPILLPWKLALMALLPAKLLVVNENGDFFWLDWRNRTVLKQFMGSRMGVDGLELLRTVSRVLVFPLVFVFLALGALAAYSRRWLRLLGWSLSGNRAATPGSPTRADFARDGVAVRERKS